MIVDPTLALRFINTYKAFLGSLVNEQDKSEEQSIQPSIRQLIKGREYHLADHTALTRYRIAHPQADANILDAIAALRVEHWVYLKDTRSYSVWLDEQGQAAYGVLGLTAPLRMVTQGHAGVGLKAGLMPLQGRWVSDALIQDFVLLGLNYRRDYNAIYRDLRAQDLFSLGPTKV
ncbi:hypothetical protein ACO0LM_13915 [Undibacterium sp. Di26W]|uniref:hypothetical protein n=1 Tax=Undibacterium sp. Di26W TaxID=3413035 RepID=UPI003BF1F48C